MKFEDIDLLKVGHEIFLNGAIYSDQNYHYLCFFPDDDPVDVRPIITLVMDLEQWKKFVRQSDLQETEIIEHGEDGKLVKAILRKSARLIDSKVSWKVYKRDKYTCRYCGRTGVPLTIDHLVLWEDGGPTIEENLLTACRKCNKIRGNMKYEDWIRSNFYENLSKNLTPFIKLQNSTKAMELDHIPRVRHIKSR